MVPSIQESTEILNPNPERFLVRTMRPVVSQGSIAERKVNAVVTLAQESCQIHSTTSYGV